MEIARNNSVNFRAHSARVLVAAIALLTGLLATSSAAEAQFQYPTQDIGLRPELLKEVGIDQKLNGSVPLDLTFRDETGPTVAAGAIVTE